jgi:integrase
MTLLNGLKEQARKEQRKSDYVFPGLRKNKPLTGAACLAQLEEMKRPELTVHGFRSTFRDWTAEQSNFPREIAEAALAHVRVNKAEAAYQRGDMLKKRSSMMDAWAKLCARPKESNVTPLRQRV